MRKLLYLFMMIGLFMACSDDDEGDEIVNGTPIAGLEVPKFEAPVKPGASITIKGEGFTEKSEIWFRQSATKAEGAQDVKAEVTAVDVAGITFKAPAVYGSQTVLLKENGKEYTLGTMTFEEQPATGGDGDILPRRVKKVRMVEDNGEIEEYEYTYDDAGRIISVRNKSYYISADGEVRMDYVEISTYTHAAGKITAKIEEETDEGPVLDATVTMELDENSRITAYSRVYEDGEKHIYNYKYGDGYLAEVDGEETDYNGKEDKYDTDNIKETFSFAEGKLMGYTYHAEGWEDSWEFDYGSQLNNLNIDLFGFLMNEYLQTYTIYDALPLGVMGKRSQYLPASMASTIVDDAKGDDNDSATYLFEYKYKTDGEGYVTEIIASYHKVGKEEEVYTDIITIEYFEE